MLDAWLKGARVIAPRLPFRETFLYERLRLCMSVMRRSLRFVASFTTLLLWMLCTRALLLLRVILAL